jgi:hypothetical protein
VSECLRRRKSGRNQSINQSHVVNDGDDDDARSTGANARAMHGVFIIIVVVVVVVAIERGNPAG